MLSTLSFVFDILILGALIVTIRQALRLNRDVAALQADRKAFEALISALTAAASRAEGAINGLRQAAIEGGDMVQEKINTARELAGELDIMIAAGDSLANRLTTTAESSRARSAPAAPQTGTSTPLSRAERDLLEALKARQNIG